MTSVETTLVSCLRVLPFPDALAVADSARRAGVEEIRLSELGELASGPGASQIRRVAREASALAANPFESMLRAIALDVPGLTPMPQVPIRDDDLVARPDLVDERLRIVMEANSFTWHGGRSAGGRCSGSATRT